jgi:sulfoacetaldehyde dehydrogenase
MDGWAIMEPAGWAMEPGRALAEMAVRDTGLGVVEDKVTKNHRKTLGLLRDLKGAKSVGVIAEYPELGIVEIARPVGVVAAITPSTNPGATPANKIINALKGRNAVILAPSPKGASTCAALLGYIHAELAKLGAPPDLVQMLPAPITKEATHALMRQADLVVATGSQANVRAAATSGTPAFGVGAGNVASIIDSSAELGRRGGGDRPLQDLRQRHQLFVREQRGDPRCGVCRRDVRPRRSRRRPAGPRTRRPSCRP